MNIFVVSDHGMIHPGDLVRVGAQAEFAGFDIASFAGTDLRLFTSNAKLAQDTVTKLNDRDPRFQARTLDGQVLITPTANNYLYIEQAGITPPTPNM